VLAQPSASSQLAHSSQTIMREITEPSSTLVLGGVRSGKSAYAERLVTERAQGRTLTYIATGEAFDDGMRTRIAGHVTRRGDLWTTREAPVELPQALLDGAGADAIVLVDCLSVWLGNLLHYDKDVAAATGELLECLPRLAGPAVFVASETGLGLLPDNELGRHFCDAAGQLNQDVAALCDEVTLVVAGYPVPVKSANE
jgi:adenosylcobinamide kinase / adenosylcobinamide-phosphate guanylyltransferase